MPNLRVGLWVVLVLFSSRFLLAQGEHAGDADRPSRRSPRPLAQPRATPGVAKSGSGLLERPRNSAAEWIPPAFVDVKKIERDKDAPPAETSKPLNLLDIRNGKGPNPGSAISENPSLSSSSSSSSATKTSSDTPASKSSGSSSGGKSSGQGGALTQAPPPPPPPLPPAPPKPPEKPKTMLENAKKLAELIPTGVPEAEALHRSGQVGLCQGSQIVGRGRLEMDSDKEKTLNVEDTAKLLNRHFSHQGKEGDKLPGYVQVGNQTYAIGDTEALTALAGALQAKAKAGVIEDQKFSTLSEAFKEAAKHPRGLDISAQGGSGLGHALTLFSDGNGNNYVVDTNNSGKKPIEIGKIGTTLDYTVKSGERFSWGGPFTTKKGLAAE